MLLDCRHCIRLICSTKQLDKITLPTPEDVQAAGNSDPLPDDQHARMLALLRFELHSRKAALQRVADIREHSHSVAQRREESLSFLHSLPAQLAALRAAAAPLGEKLGMAPPVALSSAHQLTKQPAAIRTAYTALHALCGERLPALGMPAGHVTLQDVQLCDSDAQFTNVSEKQLPSAYSSLFRQLQRERDVQGAALTQPPSKLLRSASGTDKADGSAETRLPSSAAAIFKPHPTCVRATLKSQLASGETHVTASATLTLLWLPHVAAVFSCLHSQAGQVVSLHELFPGDSGAVLPPLGHGKAPGGCLQGLPVPAAATAKPYLWAQAMSGVPTQGMAGVWVSRSEEQGAAAASAGVCVAPSARSVLAAVACRLLQSAAVQDTMKALQACCGAHGGQSIIPASPAAQAAVRKLRTALQAMHSKSGGAALPPSARLQSVALVPHEEISSDAHAAIQLALSSVGRDFSSDVAAAARAGSAWQRSLPARDSRTQSDSTGPEASHEASMREEDWLVEEVDTEVESDAGSDSGAAPATANKALYCCILKCAFAPQAPSTQAFNALLICGPQYPVSRPLVVLYCASTSSVPAQQLSLQHDPSSSMAQRLALEDFAHELNASMVSVFGAVSVSILDVVRLLQSALPLVEAAATYSSGQDEASCAWRGLLKGRARRLKLLSTVS